MIDPAIWQSGSMADLTRDQRLLFIGLFSNADDQGRLRGNPNLIRSLIFPFDDDLTSEDIKRDLQAIAAQGCIILYDVEGKELIQILNWWDYQGPQWAYPSKYQAPFGWFDRLRYRKENSVITYNWKPNRDDYSPPPDEPNEPQIPPQSPNGLGKALPKDLPINLGGPIGLVIELDNQEEKEEMHALMCVTNFYQNEIGPISPLIRDKLLDLCKLYPPDWITQAIGSAVEQNIRKLSYVQGILKNWQAIGGPQNDKPRNGTYQNGASKNGHNQTYQGQIEVRDTPGSPAPGHAEYANGQGRGSGKTGKSASDALKSIARTGSRAIGPSLPVLSELANPPNPDIPAT
jgi:DnaD/phage-associated family protein